MPAHLSHPNLSNCQIVKRAGAGLHHSDTKEGTSGKTRFSRNGKNAQRRPFASFRLLFVRPDANPCAQVKDTRQRDRVFP